MKRVVGVSLGLLALSSVARSDGGAARDAGAPEAGPTEAGPTDAGSDVGAEPAPEPTMNVCLCTLQIGLAEPTVAPLPATPELASLRDRVLASLPPDVRARLT